MDSFYVSASVDSANVYVIDMIPRQIINHNATETMAVQNGYIVADISRGLLKLAVVKRYGNSDDESTGIVPGFRLRDGALA